MKRLMTRLLFLLFYILISARGVVAATSTLHWQRDRNDLVVTLDKQVVPVEFVGVNRSDKTIYLKGIRPSCGCLTVGLDQMPKALAPGEILRFSITADGRSQSDSDRRIPVVVEYNNSVDHLEVVLKVQRPVEISPRLIVWQAAAAAESRAIEITSSGINEILIHKIDYENSKLGLKVLGTLPGKRIELLVLSRSDSDSSVSKISVLSKDKYGREYTSNAYIAQP